MNFKNSNIEFKGPVLNGCSIDKVVINVDKNDNNNLYNVCYNDEYKTWNLQQIMTWIMSLDNGKFLKFHTNLLKGFKESKILSGDILPDLDKQDLSGDPFNITNLPIKLDLIKHFKSLKHRVKSVSMKRHTRKRNRECEVNEIINYNIEDNKRKKRRKLNNKSIHNSNNTIQNTPRRRSARLANKKKAKIIKKNNRPKISNDADNYMKERHENDKNTSRRRSARLSNKKKPKIIKKKNNNKWPKISNNAANYIEERHDNDKNKP
eukprot:263919_1